MAKDKIIFLDAGTVDYGDVPLQPLHKLGNLTAYFHSTRAQLIKRCQGALHVIANKCVFDREVFSQLPQLRSLHIAATGFNNIDLKAARECGIAVTNVRGYSTESVVQLTVGFILALATELLTLEGRVQQGAWAASPFFTLAPTRIHEVHGQTLGLIGYGAIGQRVAEVARALGMNVLTAKIPGRSYRSKEAAKRVSLKTLLQKSDFISIHAPLTPLTQGLIGQAELALMKPSAFLINMARGGIVQESALLDALKKKKIRGAALDVLAQEPPLANQPLLKAPNLLVTPHVAWASVEARTRLVQEVAQNILAFQKGRKRNRIA
ncbi:MAG: D-2-hydroxyacid dehydrogenase [Candidatus Omnitrophica bacterium]|nr:D-2-hydroxyacid dehydrogenase [Candidatus Omnitrophota bacterium]